MNRIKSSGVDGCALQVTKEARTAGMIEEDSEGRAKRRADVRVFAFDGVLIVVDLDNVRDEEITELVASTARDTKTIYRAGDSKIQIAGNGYQVQIPPAEDAGFEIGDRAGCHPAPGLLVITIANGPRARDASRLAADLVEHRRAQIE